MFGKVDGSLDKEKKEEIEKGEYKAGAYIRGSLRDGNYAKRSAATKAQQIIGIIGLILLFVVMIYLIKFYSLL